MALANRSAGSRGSQHNSLFLMHPDTCRCIALARSRALLGSNSGAARSESAGHARPAGFRMHAIGGQAHPVIHALLSDHQRELLAKMVGREHSGREHTAQPPNSAASGS